MYCVKCGNEIPEGLETCPNCDTPITNNTNGNLNEEISEENVVLEEGIIMPESDDNKAYLPYDVPSNPLAALGVIVPPFGLIYYFVTRKDTPVKAKSALKGCFVGIVVYVLAGLIFNFLLLPYVKEVALKMQCEGDKSGAVYDFEKNICKYPDGSEIQILLK